MNSFSCAKLGRAGSALQWFFEPAGEVNQAGRAFLLGQLLGSPLAAIMGSFCAFIVAGAALLRSGGAIYGLFAALEAALMISRLAEWRWRARRWRHEPGQVPSVDTSVLLSTVWCTLQGALAFTIMSADDLVLSVLSATLVMAMIGPICARNYAAPRFAFMLVLLCDPSVRRRGTGRWRAMAGDHCPNYTTLPSGCDADNQDVPSIDAADARGAGTRAPPCAA